MTRDRRTLAVAALLLALPPSSVLAQAPLGTAFTYQGRLTDGSTPATGPHDFEFRLFQAATGGTQVGGTVTRDDVPVADGLFTAVLDFGSAAFAGDAGWLEIAVRPGASTGPYTTLAPRQELTPSPNALFSATAPWAGLAGIPPGFADGIDDDSGGDITSVAAGPGLSGGATSGDATLSVDTVAIQARVAGSCAPGQSIRSIAQNGTVVCEVDDVGWALTGNAGTSPAVDFIGTTDDQPLVFRTNGAVALRLSRGPVLPNVVGGSTQNGVTAGVDGATIAGGGGGTPGGANQVTEHYGSVGGGFHNVAGNDAGDVFDAQGSTVGGGFDNRAAAIWSTVGGGFTNVASGSVSVVAGGAANTASAEDTVVGGGEGNTASGVGAVVPGGVQNVAGGDSSFAAGFRARVRDAAGAGDVDGDEGTFVWADAAPPFSPFVSTGPNQFLIRAGGGVGVNTNAPEVPLDVNGVIRSRTGGFRFPDGTTQTTAATGGGGDITAVNTPTGGGLQGGVASGDASLVLLSCSDGSILKRTGSAWGCAQDSVGTVTSVTAGTGLTGGVITTSGTLAVAFAGTGAAATSARSDHHHDAAYSATGHDHLGETWSGADNPGLALAVSGDGARAVSGQASGAGGTGVHGLSSGVAGGYGVFGQSDAVEGRGVAGAATATTGIGYGVLGRAASTSGIGVQGFADASTGNTSGVAGQSLSPGGRGVAGVALATTGGAAGVYGSSSSTAGWGVLGIAQASTGQAAGVRGTSASSGGYGVQGWATAGTGTGVGVYGTANSVSGTGVLGYASGLGVWGINDAPSGTAILANSTTTTGNSRGLMGQAQSTGGVGVYGFSFASSGTTAGVQGGVNSTNGSGVRGVASSTTGFTQGVDGVAISSLGTGVFGTASASTGITNGVWGLAWSSAGGYGVYGASAATSATAATSGVVGEVQSSSSTATAVAGFAPAGAYAGYFSGRVHVTGQLSKASGSFKIDHPLDPENKYLYHSFVESPDMKNIYDGVVTTDVDGFATVEMPEWFSALNRDFRYQLTVIGKGVWAQARVYEPMANGRFVIQTDRPDVGVSWQVTGIRQDAYARAHPIPVEEDKPEAERGRYLHPEEWGQPQDAGVDAARHPRRERPPRVLDAPPAPQP